MATGDHLCSQGPRSAATKSVEPPFAIYRDTSSPALAAGRNADARQWPAGVSEPGSLASRDAGRPASNVTPASMRDSQGSLYAIVGLVLSLSSAAFALAKTRAPSSFYAVDVYHMTARSHRRFAALGAAFAAGFMFALRWPVLSVPLLAVFTLALILYASSFARGFSGEDE